MHRSNLASAFFAIQLFAHTKPVIRVAKQWAAYSLRLLDNEIDGSNHANRKHSIILDSFNNASNSLHHTPLEGGTTAERRKREKKRSYRSVGTNPILSGMIWAKPQKKRDWFKIVLQVYIWNSDFQNTKPATRQPKGFSWFIPVHPGQFRGITSTGSRKPPSQSFPIHHPSIILPFDYKQAEIQTM